MQIILKGGIVVDPSQNLEQKIDLLISDGIIEKVGNLDISKFPKAKVFDFDDKYIVPGFYDMHVHLREPGREDEETIQTGCNAAAAGGFTGIACMPNTNPAIDSAEVINYINQKAGDHLVNVNTIGAVTHKREGSSLAPIAEMVEAGAVAFSDDGVAVKTAGILRKAFEYSSMYDKPIIEHCEDESLAGGAMNEGVISTQLGLPPLPSVAEDLIVMRDILLAEYVGAKVHIAHISTKNSVKIIRYAKQKGIKVTAEVTPHHFTLTHDSLKTFDTNFKMNPPLRSKKDVLAIIDGLKDGTIDCIASDHAPHAQEEKDLEFVNAPNGILGLETQLGLALTELVHKKHITISQLVEKLSINPRKILNLPIPQIKEGTKAEITVFDLDLIWTVDVSKFKSKSKNSPFDKRLLTGKSLAVINNRKMYVDEKLINI